MRVPVCPGGSTRTTSHHSHVIIQNTSTLTLLKETPGCDFDLYFS